MMSARSEEHTSELQSRRDVVCRLLLEKKKARVDHRDARANLIDDVDEVGGVEDGPSLLGQAAHHLIDLVHGLHVEFVFFLNDTATTEIYTLSLHDALPIFQLDDLGRAQAAAAATRLAAFEPEDRKSTRLNSSHVERSDAVFCLKKKKKVVRCSERPSCWRQRTLPGIHTPYV